MISGFSIILEDDVLYNSNKKKYPSIEIVLFVEKLLRSINPKNTWRLKKICLKSQKIGKERIIIKHIVTKKNQNLFFCIIGDFLVGSNQTFNMLKEFSKQVNMNFKNLAELKEASQKPSFKQIINLITNYLKNKYIEYLKEEEIDQDFTNSNNNTILYAGISTQGLPIISQLYDRNLLLNLERETTNENVELFSSELSAKLATIAMNTQIRAKTKIKEIHLNDTEDNNNNKKIILFGNIDGYSIDFIASGNFYKIRNIFKQLKSKISLDETFKKEFSGDLKPYKHIKNYLNDVVKEFDH
ncbi:MAG: hypothetical protein ACFFA6_04740 [Promethearchaeota archaeon]